MRTLPTRLLVLVVALAGAALGALAFAVERVPIVWGQDTVILTILLIALVALARRYPVQLAPKTKTAVGTAPLFAAALLLPAPLAMAVAALAVALSDSTRRAPWFQSLFNTAEVTIRVGAGTAMFALLSDNEVLADLAARQWATVLLPTALSMYAVNGLLVDLVVGVHLRRSPLKDFWRRRGFDLPQEGALFLLGLLVAAVSTRVPWAALLLAVPTFVVYRSLRDGIALRVQTQLALEELADVIDMRDHYTFEHSRRVAALTRATAEMLHLSADQVTVIELAARVHDVGKIGIKSTVLLKPDKLNDREWREMRQHPEVGARLVSRFPQFARGHDIVLSHHERYDGGGYPRGLQGERIPLGARILATADTWDAMTSHRAYRPALDLETAHAEMERGRGTQFDPVVLDAFLAVLAARPDLAAPHTSEMQDVDGALPQPLPA